MDDSNLIARGLTKSSLRTIGESEELLNDRSNPTTDLFDETRKHVSKENQMIPSKTLIKDKASTKTSIIITEHLLDSSPIREHRRTSHIGSFFADKRRLSRDDSRSRSDRKRSSTQVEWSLKRDSTKSTILSSLSSRKRSSTTCNSNVKLPPIPTITQVFQNSSIFKQDPNQDQVKTLVTTSENIITEESLMSRPAANNGYSPHIKSFSVSIPIDYEVNKRRKSFFFPDIVKTSQIPPLPLKNEKLTNNIEKSDMKLHSRLENVRIPRKWFSLRNVLSFFNIWILALSILVISLVSHFSTVGSFKFVSNYVGNSSLTVVSDRIDSMLEAVFVLNSFSESILSTTEYSYSNAQKALRQLYFMKTRSPDFVYQIYAFSNDSNYVGSSSVLDSNGNMKNAISLRYSGKITSGRLLTYEVDGSCTSGNFNCVNQAFDPKSRPLSNLTFQVSEFFYFNQAVSGRRVGCTHVYNLFGNSVLGITAYNPVYQFNKLRFISAIDISLDSLSKMISEVSNNIEGNVFMFIVDQNYKLIASSDQNYAPSIVNQGVIDVSDSIEEVQTTRNMGNQASAILDVNNKLVYLVRYIRLSNDIQWIIGVSIPKSNFDSGSKYQYLMVPLSSLIVMILATICSIMITKWIASPLKSVAQNMMKIAELDFDFIENSSENRSEKTSAFDLKEVRYLNSAMQSMKSALKSFSKYVPMDIVALLVKMKREAVLGVDEIDITIFFSDIVNFTTLSESLSPKILVQMISEYLSEMSSIIVESNGVVDKYIGDAVMAFWNAPISQMEHATIACSVALKCQARLKELNISWKERGLPELKTRIGLNSGLSLVGNVGSWFRLNYTCLGDNVNLASRLEGLNKRYETGIIISEYTYSKTQKEYFLVRTLDIVCVKGKTKPVRVYELVGFRKLMSSSTIEAFKIYEEAFDSYLQRHFDDAIQKLQLFLKDYSSSDCPSWKLLKKCQQLKEETLDEDWTGIVLIDEK